MIPKRQFNFGNRATVDPRAEQVYLASVHQDWPTVQKLVQDGAPCTYQSVRWDAVREGIAL